LHKLNHYETGLFTEDAKALSTAMEMQYNYLSHDAPSPLKWSDLRR